MTEVATIPQAGVPAASMFEAPEGRRPTSLEIMLTPKLFEQAQTAALYLSKSAGFVPPHLLGKTESCFSVVMQANDWNMAPLHVARCIYQTPGGQVGYYGKLIHAILERSGHFDGPITYEHIGDWNRLVGKWKKGTGNSGKEYAQRTWDYADAEGLGVIVRGKLKGEIEPRALTVWLVECFPLNSTLWATSPRLQICYTAARRFGDLAVPHILMGAPFDREDWPEEHVGPERARDVTPPRTAAPVVEDTVSVVDEDGQAWEIQPGQLEAWAKEHAAAAPDAALKDMLEANENVAVQQAIMAEMQRREAKAKPQAESQRQEQPRNGNGVPSEFVLVDQTGKQIAKGPAMAILERIEEIWKQEGGRRSLTHRVNLMNLDGMIKVLEGRFRELAESRWTDISEDVNATRRGGQQGML